MPRKAKQLLSSRRKKESPLSFSNIMTIIRLKATVLITNKYYTNIKHTCFIWSIGLPFPVSRSDRSAPRSPRIRFCFNVSFIARTALKNAEIILTKIHQRILGVCKSYTEEIIREVKGGNEDKWAYAIGSVQELETWKISLNGLLVNGEAKNESPNREMQLHMNI